MRTITNPAEDSDISSSVMRSELQTLETEIANTSTGHSHDGSDSKKIDYADIENTPNPTSYAPASEGVTNGNTHNHVGGDGGSIPEDALSLSDNTTSNVSTSAHGFAPKLSGNAGQYLNGVGIYSSPSGSGDVLGPATNSADYIPQWDGVSTKTLKNGYSVVGLLSLLYPVGTIYTNRTDATNPATLLGFGTWTAIAGRVMVGVGTSDQAFNANTTGGASTVTLTGAQSGVASHTHAVSAGAGAGFYTTKGVAGSGELSGVQSGTSFSGSTANDQISRSSLSNATAANASSAHNNLQPYATAYIWERTA